MMIIKHIGHVLMLLLLMSGLNSCIYNNEDEEPEPATATSNILSLDIEVPDINLEAAEGNGQYEPGVDFENYIDLSANGLRIYLFDYSNKFITRLVSMEPVTTNNSGDQTSYTVTGFLPKNFNKIRNFKVVVLANWPVYIDDLVPEVSTIDDLCNAEWAKFDRPTDFRLSADNKIPFFGIHEYTGVTFTPDQTTVLPEPITLLRAMAKVEVIIDNEDVELTDAVIHGFNLKGYCAPQGVYRKSDYDHNGVWSEDYARMLHLVGDGNNISQVNNKARLYRKHQRSATQKETWVCYVPEYRNTNESNGQSNYKSHLDLTFDFQESTEEPFRVDFMQYNENRKPVENSYFDIHRNNLYRFNVNFSHGNLFIRVQKWEAAYDNDFIFE